MPLYTLWLFRHSFRVFLIKVAFLSRVFHASLMEYLNVFLYCFYVVRVAIGVEFADHVFSHSVSAEAPALRPPGCALRAYGCRACSTTNLVPTASSSSRNPSKGTATMKGFSSGSVALNGWGRECEVEKKGHGKTKKKDNRGGDVSGRFGHSLKSCPMYWLFCPSCEKEVRWMFLSSLRFLFINTMCWGKYHYIRLDMITILEFLRSIPSVMIRTSSILCILFPLAGYSLIKGGISSGICHSKGWFSLTRR